MSLEVGSFFYRLGKKSLRRGAKRFVGVDRSKRKKNKRRKTAGAEKARLHTKTPDEGGRRGGEVRARRELQAGDLRAHRKSAENYASGVPPQRPHKQEESRRAIQVP